MVSTPGKRLAIHRYERDEPLILATGSFNTTQPMPLCFLQDGEKAVGSGPAGDTIHIWDARNGAVLQALKVQQRFSSIAVSR